ncbi:MAG: DNA polymerase III subunit gamma/tau [Crocosphaera sp.]|nr:DNA polymerase III subunit gamma/tau [Crocosphaera sp.]
MSSYEPLHHKYRPQTFADLVGQEAIATTLTNAIATQRIAPAYLFTGPRGTGKTSSARILAKSLNCLAVDVPTASPCGECEVCRAIARGSALDVIEIDAASNTGVDNIREIIERSQFAPVQCRYKVYVIDECHMLSVAAFNALLKTLEEPPERVIFVLATTDPQRVLPTIISRCQRFDYRRIPLEGMVNHLRKIAQQESIEIEAEALTLVAQISNGGLRDAESLLDQLSLLSGSITPDKVWDLVGAVPERDLLSLLQAINSNNPEFVIESCRKLMDRGREPLVVLQNLAGFYLNLLIAKTASTRSDLVAVTSTTWHDLCEEAKQWKIETILRGQQKLKESEFQLKNTTQPRLWLEVTLLGLLPDACQQEMVIESPPELRKSKTNTESKVTVSPQQKLAPKSHNNSSQSQSKPPINYQNEPVLNTSIEATQNDNIDDEKLWQLVLTNLPPFLSGLIKEHGFLIDYTKNVAKVSLKTGPLLNLAKGKMVEIESAFEKSLGHKVKVHLQVGSALKPKKSSSQSSTLENSQIYPTKPPNIKNNTHINNNVQTNNVEKKDDDHNYQETDKLEENHELRETEHIQSNTNLTEVSQDKIKQAIQQFATFFKGEIVSNDLELNIPKNEASEENNQVFEQKTETENISNIEYKNSAHDEVVIESDKKDINESVETYKSTKIANRPQILDNDENLEF